MFAFRAVVVGASGACGKSLIKELVECPKYSRITTLGRKELQLTEEAKKSGKIEQHVIDMEKLENCKKEVANHEVAFCCLGTTRKEAGSAEAFRKVDFFMVTEFGKICKEAGIPHFLVVSAQLSNSSSWFLYPKTKGQAEDELKKLEFPRLSIFKPGLMDRGKDTRGVEKVAAWFQSPIHVDTIAKSMMYIAISKANDKPTTPVVDQYHNAQMFAHAKEPTK